MPTPRDIRRKLIWRIWLGLLILGATAIIIFFEDDTAKPAFVLNWVMLCVVVLLPLHLVRLALEKIFAKQLATPGFGRKLGVGIGALVAFVALGLAALEFLPTF